MLGGLFAGQAQAAKRAEGRTFGADFSTFGWRLRKGFVFYQGLKEQINIFVFLSHNKGMKKEEKQNKNLQKNAKKDLKIQKKDKKTAKNSKNSTFIFK